MDADKATDPWYYIELCLQGRGQDLSSRCPHGNCVTAKIDEYARRRRLPKPKPEPEATLDDSDMMTLQEVADYLNCHYSTVLRLIHHGHLPVFKFGGNWRCLRPDLEKWIAAGGGKRSGSAPAKTNGRRRHKRKTTPKTTLI